MNEDATQRAHPLIAIDDHQLVGVALSAAFAETPLRLTGSFPTADAALRSGVEADLALLDLRLADGSSPASNVAALLQRGIPVLAFTSAEDGFLVREALRAGALGILRKSASVDAILAAIESTIDGRPFANSEWAHALDSDPRIVDAGLSPQEARVLQLFADGARAQVVAAQLFITVGTLEDYVRRIRAKYTKVGRPAQTKVDLYKRAVEDGLLPRPSSA